jgi:hypothetical protein
MKADDHMLPPKLAKVEFIVHNVNGVSTGINKPRVNENKRLLAIRLVLRNQ